MSTGSGSLPPVDFDEYASDYDAALNRGISLSGEGKDFFARGRIEWLRSCLTEAPCDQVLDFGCGTGSTAPLLKQLLGARSVIGVDTSAEEIATAKRSAQPDIAFCTIAERSPGGDIDVAYCNGVFHHIPPSERAGALQYVRDSLRPGGLFAFWENNPWNPGTRLVMSRIPFDRDAILVSAREARRLAVAAGFEVLSTHFLFLFPKALSVFRPLERSLMALPFGAQYQVLCRKPA